MGNEEAISILRHVRNLLTTRTFEEDALDIAIQSIEKQIPKKIEYGDDNGKQRKSCGSCGCFILSGSNYCSKCGQKTESNSICNSEDWMSLSEPHWKDRMMNTFLGGR